MMLTTEKRKYQPTIKPLHNHWPRDKPTVHFTPDHYIVFLTRYFPHVEPLHTQDYKRVLASVKECDKMLGEDLPWTKKLLVPLR